jgi:4-amino-4-deoxy-L-arabinose transferase-like glycosyltransferase
MHFRNGAAPGPPRRLFRPSTGTLLAAVLALAGGVRAANWAQVRDGSILYFHTWDQSDMHFFHEWGRRIAEGDLLSAPRPYHRWHGEVALEVHRRQRPGVPFDERRGRELWQEWLGTAAFYQDPLYAYLLGGFYRVLGPRVEPVLLAQTAMGLGCVALVFALGWMLDGRWTAAAGGVMAGLYAPLIFYEGTLLRGVLQALLSLAAVAAAQQGLRSARPGRWWLAAGAAGGLLVTTHSTGLLLVAALAALAAVTERGARLRSALLLCAAGCVAALLPFALRNAAVGLSPLAAPAYGPVNFIISNAADRNPWVGFPISEHTDEILQATGGRLWPVVRATLATHESFWSWASLTAQKVLVFVSWRETVDNVNFAYYLMQAPLVASAGLRFAVVLPLAVAGLAMAGRRRLSGAVPALLGIATGALVAVAFFTSSRLRLTTALLLVPFAGLAIVEGVRRLAAGRRRSLAWPGAAAAVAVVAVLAPWVPAAPLVRDSDHAVGAAIALQRARARATEGRTEGALRTLRVQLRTEPEALREIEPGQVVSERGAREAVFFVDLHRAAAALHEARGDREEAWEHARRARILDAVVAQYAARGGSLRR